MPPQPPGQAALQLINDLGTPRHEARRPVLAHLPRQDTVSLKPFSSPPCLHRGIIHLYGCNIRLVHKSYKTRMTGWVHGVKGVRFTRVHASAMMAMRQLSSTMLSENLRSTQACQVSWKPV